MSDINTPRLLCFLVCILLFCCTPGSAGIPVPDLGIYAGFGISDFESGFPLGFTEHDRSSYMPGGVQLYWNLGSQLRIGADLSISLIPFTWDERGSNATEKITQTLLRPILRYEVMKGSIVPHIALGGGLCLGSWKLDYDEDAGYADQTFDFKPALNIDVSGGMTIHVDPERFLFFELAYSTTKRTLDTSDAPGFAYATWTMRLGIVGPPW